VNKLVSVLPRKSRFVLSQLPPILPGFNSLIRYHGEIGDVVVGRVVATEQSRWRVDINARQSAALLLSSINMPGIQRRKTSEDELNMRKILKEGEIICAEVQSIFGDGSIHLHTPSYRYGKVRMRGFGGTHFINYYRCSWFTATYALSLPLSFSDNRRISCRFLMAYLW